MSEQKKNRRRRWLWLLLIPLILIVLTCVGNLPARLVEPVARRIVADLPFQVDWSTLKGNLLTGFKAYDLTVKTSDGTEAAGLPEVRAAFAGFAGKKPKLKITVKGGRVSVGGLQKLIASFPKSDQPSAGLPVAFTPLTIDDLSGADLPWAVEHAELGLTESVYALDVQGSYRSLPFTLSGTLGPDLTSPHPDVTLQTLGGDIRLFGAVNDRLTVEGSGIDFSTLAPLYPGAELSGTLALEGSYEIPSARGDFFLRARQLKGFGTQLGDGSMQLSVADNLLTLKNVKAQVLGAPLRLAGTLGLTGDRPLKLQGIVGAGGLNQVGRALPLSGPLSQVGVGLDNLRFAVEGPLKAPNGQAKLQGGWVNWKGVKAQNITVGAEMRAGVPTGWITGQLLGGTVKAGLTSLKPLDLQADVSGLQLAGLQTLVPDLGLSGTATLRVTAKGDADNPQFTLQAQGQNLVFRDMTIDRLDLQGRGTKDQFTVRPLTARLFGGTLAGELTAQDVFGPVKVQFALKGGDFTASGITRGLRAVTLQSLDKGNGLDVTGSFDSAAGLGALQASAEVRVPGVRAYGVDGHNLKLKAKMEGAKITVEGLDGVVLGAPLSARGVLPLVSAGEADFTVQWNDFDLARADVGVTGKASLDLQAEGPLEKLDLQGRVVSDRASWGALVLKNIRAQVGGTGPWSARISADGPDGAALVGTVTATPGEGSPRLNGSIDARGFEAATLAMGKAPVEGKVSLNADFSGTLTDPQVTFAATSPQLKAAGFAFPDLTAHGSYGGGKIKAQAQSVLGGGPLEAEVLADFSEGVRADFKVNARGAEVSRLAADLPVAGKASLVSSGTFAEGKLAAQARLKSDGLTVQGYRLEAIDLPVTVEQNVLNLKEGSASFAGAPLKVWAKGDLAALKFEYGATCHGMNAAELVAPYKLPGKVSGSVNVDAQGEAHKSMNLIANITAKVLGENIEVSDLPYMKLVTGGAPVKVRTAQLTFTISPDEVFLMPGSSLSAWPDDPVFKYVTLSGPVWRKGLPKNAGMPQEMLDERRDTIRLAVNGNINVKALNSLLGGVGVLVNTLAKGGAFDARQVATDVVGGLFSGAKDQFRDLSFTLAGPYDDLRVDNLQVANDITFDDANDWAYGGRKLKEKGRTRSDRYTLKFVIPVGPGEGKGKSLTNQATNQVLGAIINSLVPEDW